MVDGEGSLLWLEGNVEDAPVPDKEANINPRHYGGGKGDSLDRDGAGDEELTGSKPRLRAYGEEIADLDEEDDCN